MSKTNGTGFLPSGKNLFKVSKTTFFELLTFIDGMAMKSREDFHVFLQFERLEIEGIVLLMLVYVNRM